MFLLTNSRSEDADESAIKFKFDTVKAGHLVLPTLNVYLLNMLQLIA